MPSAAQSISVAAAAQSHPSPGQEDQGCSLDTHTQGQTGFVLAVSWLLLAMVALGGGRSITGPRQLLLTSGCSVVIISIIGIIKTFFSSECFLASFGVREQL